MEAGATIGVATVAVRPLWATFQPSDNISANWCNTLRGGGAAGSSSRVLHANLQKMTDLVANLGGWCLDSAAPVMKVEMLACAFAPWLPARPPQMLQQRSACLGMSAAKSTPKETADLLSFVVPYAFDLRLRHFSMTIQTDSVTMLREHPCLNMDA